MKYSCDTCSEEYKAETAVQDTVKGLHVARASRLNNFDNNSNFNADNHNVNNHNALRGIAQQAETIYNIARDLWKELCGYDNLFLAYQKARKHKTTKQYVIDFEKNLRGNLLLLNSELLLHSYSPKPLVNFTIRDPKTRKISKSDFRDMVVHHALCNIIEPIFEKGFIYDSYANRIGKGTLKAIGRFDFFKKKVSKNNTAKCYLLKADVQTYFENIDHGILLKIIKNKIADKRIIWLIRRILANSSCKEGRGMPLGNLTSQFFANVYLNELDWFVKNKLKAKYYIRYVDDFVIFNSDRKKLEFYKEEINQFLKSRLEVQMHPDKSRIFRLGNCINFLGFRAFYHHKIIKKSNLRKMRNMLQFLKEKYRNRNIDYDSLYDFLEGWIAYAKNSNTYNLRRKILAEFEHEFLKEISTKEINRYLKMQKKYDYGEKESKMASFTDKV